VTKPRLLIGSLACSAVLIAAGTVWASTIVGTPGGDTLRGGARADKVYGKGGNDKLYGAAGNDKLYGAAGNDLLIGGPGNDLLVGGTGADTLRCGSGRDTASRDLRDEVATDCEVVRGPRPTPTPRPPLPPLPPPTPPAPKALPGLYCGNTDQGPSLCLRTNADASAVDMFETSSIVDCTPPLRFEVTLTFGGASRALIQSDRSFSFEYTGPLTSGSREIGNIQTSYFARGVFTTDGKAEGTLAVTSLSFDFELHHYECAQNPVRWAVTKQG
jgi:hypothetical protein